ncbi:MAG: ABC transporter ATP-binding protein [Thermoplasmata archaeon]|nr:ABC transporter ATP-binding protein [Thermoplasmata archaeon]
MTEPPAVVMRATGVRKTFRPNRGVFASLVHGGGRLVRAVEDVSLTIGRGEVVSLVGESGSGKTTLGEVLAMLQRPSGGSIVLHGEELSGLSSRALRPYRRHMQVVFQDPYQSLDPRLTVFRTVAEPIQVNEDLTRDEVYARVVAMLDDVGLSPAEAFLYKYPRELSGGQRQRVAIARALILNPAFVVADEPVSMLDVSVASGILNLMLDLRSKLGTAFLFITHDLAVARYVSDRIAIMYRGRIVEIGPAAEVTGHPLHPYTQLLLSAVPVVNVAAKRERVTSDLETADLEQDAIGCAFQFRCPFVMDQCRAAVPPLLEVEPGHFAACYQYPGPA